MKQGLGDHAGAVRELDAGIAAADSEAQRIELRFLRGASCNVRCAENAGRANL